MTLDQAVALAALFISGISAISAVDSNQGKNIPIGWWVAHFLTCILAGLLFPRKYDLLVLLWILIFFSVLIDAHFSALFAQASLLLLSFSLIIASIGLSKITTTASGWLYITIIFSGLFALPILVGMKFFWRLQEEGFPKLVVALLLSLDYFLGLLMGDIVTNVLMIRN